jgi:hypothetical protein
MNPLFNPQPPLNDSTKEEIWLKFTQEQQTPRKIGFDYGISLKRVEAILKLKKLEKDMVKKVCLFNYNFILSVFYRIFFHNCNDVKNKKKNRLVLKTLNMVIMPNNY